MNRRPVPLRSWPTAVGGLVIFLSCGSLLLSSIFSSPAAGVPFPERALARVAGRTLQLREAVARIPSWERRLHAVFDPSLGSAEEFSQLIQWHRELARLAKEPVILAHLGVLEGEAGQTELLRTQTERWAAQAPDPIPAYARLLQAAYLGAPVPAGAQAEVRELLPPDWFRDRLQERIARRDGDLSQAGAIREADRAASRRLFFRYRLATGLDFTLMFLFFACLALFAAKPAGFWKAGGASIPLPWPFPDGMAALMRGAGLGIGLSFIYAFLPFSSNPAAAVFSYLLWTLPVLLLVRQYFLRPDGLLLRRQLGLDVPARQWGKLLFIALLGLGADSLGGWLIGMAGSFARLPNHWAESFDADLVFGSRAALAAGLAGIVLAGPFFEELVFRGLLYGTLRGRFGRAGAAAVSAGFFSLVHGYGLLGFLTVFWSGLVFAWLYEESESLWPSIAAHAAGNLLYSLNVIAMLRMG